MNGVDITLDGGATKTTGDDGTGMVNFGLLSGAHTLVETPQIDFTSALVFDAGTGILLDTITDPNAINLNVDRNLDVYIGNVPEPASLTLLCLGAGGIMLRRQRRR